MAIDVNRMIHLFGLDGKVAVVTGGSRGIGYMIVGGLLDAGCRVIISARKEHQVKAAAAELETSGFSAPRRPGPDRQRRFHLDDPSTRAEVAAAIPLGRIGTPDDIAGAVIYLVGRAGSYLTGVVLPVSGGRACVSD